MRTTPKTYWISMIIMIIDVKSVSINSMISPI